MCEHNVYNIYGRVCVWHMAFVACVLAVGWIIGICGRVYNHGTWLVCSLGVLYARCVLDSALVEGCCAGSPGKAALPTPGRGSVAPPPHTHTLGRRILATLSLCLTGKNQANSRALRVFWLESRPQLLRAQRGGSQRPGSSQGGF